MGIKFTAAVAAFMTLLAAEAVHSEPVNNSQQAIEYMIGYVARSGATFIRNGKSYTANEAAAHLKSKYDYFKRDIATPEDFIRLAGSKSELSGKPYQVQTQDGHFVASADWLRQILTEYRITR